MIRKLHERETEMYVERRGTVWVLRLVNEERKETVQCLFLVERTHCPSEKWETETVDLSPLQENYC